jgi:hypothetical protein
LQVSLCSSQATRSQFFSNNTRLFVHTESLLRSGGCGGVGVLGGVRVWPPHASSPPPSLGTRLFSIWRPNGDEGQHLLTARTRMMPILFGFCLGNLFLDPTPRTILKPWHPRPLNPKPYSSNSYNADSLGGFFLANLFLDLPTPRTTLKPWSSTLLKTLALDQPWTSNPEPWFLTIGQLAFVGDGQCLLTAQTSMMLIQCFLGNLFWISQSYPKLLNH